MDEGKNQVEEKVEGKTEVKSSNEFIEKCKKNPWMCSTGVLAVVLIILLAN